MGIIEAIAAAIGAALTIIAALVKWYTDKDRLRGKALQVAKELGESEQKKLDDAAKNNDAGVISAIMQQLHDSRRVCESSPEGLSHDNIGESGNKNLSTGSKE